MKNSTIIFIIIVLLLLFTGFILPRLLPSPEAPFGQHKWDSARPKMAVIESAIGAYLLNTGQYPTSLDDLISSPGLSGWVGPYLDEKQLYDPWDRLFIYKRYSDTYQLKSYGADGEPGGEGENEDIYND